MSLQEAECHEVPAPFSTITLGSCIFIIFSSKMNDSSNGNTTEYNRRVEESKFNVKQAKVMCLRIESFGGKRDVELFPFCAFPVGNAGKTRKRGKSSIGGGETQARSRGHVTRRAVSCFPPLHGGQSDRPSTQASASQTSSLFLGVKSPQLK